MDHINVIIKPLVTEKSTHQQQTRNAYAFQVHADANKLPVRAPSGRRLKTLGLSNGSGLPLSRVTRGLGSRRSNWDGPPGMNRKIQRLARGA